MTKYLHAGCMGRIDAMANYIMSPAGLQKVDRVFQAFCCSKFGGEPFLVDSDLVDIVKDFPQDVLEDGTARHGLRMLHRCPWIFTEQATIFKQMVEDVVRYVAPSAGLFFCIACIIDSVFQSFVRAPAQHAYLNSQAQ